MKVSIKEPCSANWDEMKIGLISRHCDQCDKNVMDFTQMNRGEIIAHLLSNPNESTCGRMRRDQFDFKHEDIPILVEAIQKHRPSNPFLIIALVSLSLASCSSEHSGKIKTPPAVIQPVEKDTTQIETDTTNIDSGEDTSEISKVAPVPTPPPPPPIPPVGMIEMGEVVPMPGPDIEPVFEPEQFIPEQTDDDKIYEIVEEMPEFPGGVEALMKFISSNIRYPKSAIDQGIQGNMYAQFVVEKDGSLTQLIIHRSLGPDFDSEVKRLMSIMPNWNPGKQQGKIVRCKMTIPIRFVLS